MGGGSAIQCRVLGAVVCLVILPFTIDDIPGLALMPGLAAFMMAVLAMILGVVGVRMGKEHA